MNDLASMTRIFDLQGFKYGMRVVGDRKPTTTVSLEVGSPGVDGYAGFGVDFTFDSNGLLVGINLAEG